MIPRRLSARLSPLTCALLLLALTVFFFSSTFRSGSSRASSSSIHNSTLGFEKVLAIGLPERTDKRDALALTSSLTGFHIDWIPGVKGQTIPDKAVPYGADRKKIWENNLGSWRGHMNAVRAIIENNWSSALIMEDDMDWDVRLKTQLERFSKGSQYVLDSQGKVTNSPYGDDWDLLWLGHCGEVFPETLEEFKNLRPTDEKYIQLAKKFGIEHDETMPPADKTTGFQDFKSYPHVRWVHSTGAPICTFAYALSLRGAQKVLFDLSVDHLVGPFDNALSGLCRWGRDPEKLGMKCVSSTPGLFFHHKAKGSVSGDSDIQKVGGEKGKGEVREKGVTENVVWSARNNIRNVLLGLQLESQYDHA
jgi:hypothetical protein